MTDVDDWGRDPSVQFLRKVFKGMENAQQELLKRLDIASYDPRIRRWRDQALALFEKGCGVATRMGITMDENTASVIYVYCFAKIMGAERIRVPPDIMPDAKAVERILKEVLS